MEAKRFSVAVVVVAAGRGTRAGPGGPKQYRRIAGRTVLEHTLDAFLTHPSVDRVQPVLHADDFETYAALGLRHGRLALPVGGGATRQASVACGLEAMTGDPPHVVLVHDAARPFVDADTIDAVIEAAAEHGAALPVLPVADTLKRSDGNRIVETVDRDAYVRAQTPQGFAFDALLAAHRSSADGATDDAALMERAGATVVTVPGDPRNRKLTTGQDLEEAQRMMDASSLPDVRVGHGYDTHRTTEGDHVWLCGLRIDHDRGLDGHSDADIGLHALTDALLATIGDGDIGSHFPPTDERWRDAASDAFLRHAVGLVRDREGRITHLDVTLVCEAPKIGPHRDDMRARIGEIAGVETGRVSVKATTNERTGFVGREEGMVALATATVVFP